MSITETVNSKIKSLVEDVKSLTDELAKVDVSDLQGKAKTAAVSAYADLAKRGEEFVAAAKAIKVDDVKSVAKVYADKAEETVNETVAKVTKKKAPVTKKASTTAPAPAAPATPPAAAKAAPAKKTPAKKAPAAKKATGAAKKTTAVKKAPASKATTPAKSAPAAKKAPAKNAPAAKKTPSNATTPQV